MKKRPLGTTGLSVSEIAFGGVEIGVPYGIGVESEADMLSQQEAIDLLHEALDKGINFFDTARLYGASETIMGNAFEGRRGEIVLATKCKHLRGKDGQLPADRQLKTIIETSLQESLAALKMDYVDVYMLHQVDAEILSRAVIADTFAGLKEKGLIRATGASTYFTAETELAIESGNWNVIQLPFNLMDQTHSQCFDKAAQHGIGLVIRSVLMKGLLSDRGKNLHPALSQVETHIQNYRRLLNENLSDLPTLATQFALSFDSVSSVLIGIDKKEYLHKALRTANGFYLDEKLLRQATQLAYPDPDFLNMTHWHNMGWLK
ncbi:aldo/keto reductase [Spirosoma sp. BT702]|uniref:Aldo/keto reductase n=1 Tax=Spirosoma profusum TaxID=2771354 RepID=A0A926XZ14_9BACT|nr:aldo/keto reductase [Spirosoma profusum]MBD2703538.1 aldo/keto reductase [Spirosoma profusum]